MRRSVWLAVDGGVRKKVELLGHLMHHATVCVDGEVRSEQRCVEDPRPRVRLPGHI